MEKYITFRLNQPRYNMKTRLNLWVVLFTLLMFFSCAEKKESEPSEKDESKAQMESRILDSNKALFQAWNDQDMNLIDQHMAEDFVRYQNGEKTGEGRQAYKDLMNQFLTAMPDMNFSYDSIEVIGNKTYTQWTATGTQTGKFGDLPPSNIKTTVHGFTVGTYNDEGLNTKEETYMDPLSFLEPWGYTLSPPEEE